MANGKGIKVYVSVDVAFNEDSVILPRQIIWEDGHKSMLRANPRKEKNRGKQAA